MRSSAAALLAGVVLAAGPLHAGPLHSESLEPAELVERVERIFRGETVEMKASMTVERPRWTRTIEFRSWDARRSDRSLVRILAPSKDRGTGFLRDGRTFWTYLPRVERTTRIPPSMMLQPWMGSDFTNDDLVRESSLVEDYAATSLGRRAVDGVACVGIELLPKADAPVVWSRIEVWLDVERLTPFRMTYFDEPEPGRFEPLREMRYSDVREVQGRPLPHRWVMVPLDKPGHVTRMELEEVKFDQAFETDLFSLANLKRAEVSR